MNSLLRKKDFAKVDEVLVGELPHDLDFHEQVHLNQITLHDD